MLKRNQKGFMDHWLIIGILIVLLVGGFVAWRIMSSDDAEPEQAETTIETDEDQTSVEQTPIQYTEYEDIGLKHELPDGWERSQETTNEASGSIEYTVSNPNNDLQIVLTTAGFKGGFEGCSGPGVPNMNSFIDRNIILSQNIGYEGYHLVGYREVRVPEGTVGTGDKLVVANSNESNWYDSVPATTEGLTDERVNAADLSVGNTYSNCVGEPAPGFGITTPKKYEFEDFSGLTRISIVSESDKLLEAMNSNSSDLNEVIDILNSISEL